MPSMASGIYRHFTPEEAQSYNWRGVPKTTIRDPWERTMPRSPASKSDHVFPMAMFPPYDRRPFTDGKSFGDVDDDSSYRSSYKEAVNIPEDDATAIDYTPSFISTPSATDTFRSLTLTSESFDSNSAVSFGDEIGAGGLLSATPKSTPSSRYRALFQHERARGPMQFSHGILPEPASSLTRKSHFNGVSSGRRVDSNFLRLNFALLNVIVHIGTQEIPPSALTGAHTAITRINNLLNSGSLFFPLLAHILFKPSSSNISKWVRNSGLHLNPFWSRMLSLIAVAVIKMLVVVEVFQYQPRWMGILLLIFAVAAIALLLVVVLVMNLFHDNHELQRNTGEKSIPSVINVVYGSLIVVHVLEMRPSLLSAIINASPPNDKPTQPSLLHVASLCFNTAIILQLPALFLEASGVRFCNCVATRGGNSAGLTSLLLTVLFQMSLSSFLAAIGVTLFTNDVSMLGFCLYVGLAAIFMILVGCYQLGILPARSILIKKQRVE